MNVPSTVSRHSMLLRSALLTKVLVGSLAFFDYANTAAMLPDATTIAQNEEPADLVGLRVGNVGECFAQRRSWVFLLCAYASCNLFLFNCLFVVVFDSFGVFGRPLFLGGRLALTTTRHGRFAEVFAG